MQNLNKKKKMGGWIMAAFVVWLVMNIRVAAGIGTIFERAVDGLVGITLLVIAVFLALDFFGLTGKKR
ncbi:MAG: hypothetical protein M8357_10790 [Desulfobulbaceae bacterium]|nr:hypothetical protein [Desulfobulbaceae bacterium]